MNRKGFMDMHDHTEQKKLSFGQLMDFTTAVNPLGPSKKAKNVLRRHLGGLEFFPGKEDRCLRGLIARNENVDDDNILIGEGSTFLLNAILRAIKPVRVFIPAPVSQELRKLISYSGAMLEEQPSEGKNFVSMDLHKILKGMEKTDAVIMPHPHNMVGATLAVDDLHMLIAEADAQDKVLILDESYRDFTTMNSPVKKVIISKSVIIVRTFSLFYALAGLPIGYAIGPQGMIEKMRTSIFPGKTNTLAIHAAIASLKDKSYKERTHRFIDEEKKYFFKALAAIDGVVYLDTPCPFFVLRVEKEPGHLKDIFSRHGILIDDFFFGEKSERYLRVPIRKHGWNARFLKTLKNALGED